ncbi:hypothetical protein L3i23_27050 [Herbiconiux sp. L3-i23]|nr:hypothetical protein L3i23_27050 [Herbiconiux sp. L3-i23]
MTAAVSRSETRVLPFCSGSSDQGASRPDAISVTEPGTRAPIVASGASGVGGAEGAGGGVLPRGAGEQAASAAVNPNAAARSATVGAATTKRRRAIAPASQGRLEKRP